MTVTAPEQDTYTPHASSTAALKEAKITLIEVAEKLSDIDLRSLKGELRTHVKDARESVDAALKTSRKR